MRIALIGPAHPYKGGGALHTTELAHRLAAAGHDVVIESWRELYPSFLYPGVQTVEVPDAEPFPRTRRELSWRRPDGWIRAGRRLHESCDVAVFTYLAPVQVPAYLGVIRGLRRRGARPGPRVAVTCHNVLPHERRPGDVTLTRALLRRSDGVLTHTERLARMARGLAPGTPVVVAELPPHLPMAPGRANPGVARPGRFNAGTGPVGRPNPGAAPPADAGPTETVDRHLLFFGIVRPYKGLDVLLRAMAQAPDRLTLTVAGEFWGGTDAARALIAELGLDGRVELRPGYVPAHGIAALLDGSDALVLPYRSATASQNAWLAFSHGVPVIATRTGTFAEQVTDGVDGLLCEPGDPGSLALALTRFCAPGEAERLRTGVRPVDSRPLWDSYLKALLSLGSPGPS
ncbi:MAG: glycosyltransferase family 4 protein [Micromonosporaceae bacterium]